MTGSAKIFHYRQAHPENLYLFAIWVPSPWLHHTHTRTPLANVRHCLPPPAAFGFRLLESSFKVAFRVDETLVWHTRPDPPDPADWCYQVPLRPSLPHTPGVRMTAVITNSLKLYLMYMLFVFIIFDGILLYLMILYFGTVALAVKIYQLFL